MSLGTISENLEYIHKQSYELHKELEKQRERLYLVLLNKLKSIEKLNFFSLTDEQKQIILSFIYPQCKSLGVLVGSEGRWLALYDIWYNLTHDKTIRRGFVGSAQEKRQMRDLVTGKLKKLVEMGILETKLISRKYLGKWTGGKETVYRLTYFGESLAYLITTEQLDTHFFTANVAKCHSTMERIMRATSTSGKI